MITLVISVALMTLSLSTISTVIFARVSLTLESNAGSACPGYSRAVIIARICPSLKVDKSISSSCQRSLNAVASRMICTPLISVNTICSSSPSRALIAIPYKSTTGVSAKLINPSPPSKIVIDNLSGKKLS